MATEFNFLNKIVLITGSSGGIGSVMAKEFAKRGATLVLTGRRMDALEKLANECSNLSQNGVKHFLYAADVTNKENRKSLINSVIEKYGRIDVLINNAGGGAFGSIYDEKLLDNLQRMMDLNLNSVVGLIQLAIPHIEKVKGVIVNISSTLGQQPNQFFMPYCVAKAALDMFSKSIAIELGPKGVRVNCVSPTAIRTNFQNATGQSETLEGVLKHLEQTIPLRRIATVEDVTNAVLFLASDKSSFITGANIVVDGGNSVV